MSPAKTPSKTTKTRQFPVSDNSGNHLPPQSHLVRSTPVHHLTNAWWLQDIELSVDKLLIPKKLLFRDYLYTKPQDHIDLKNFHVNKELFDVINIRCRSVVKTLRLDHVIGLNIDLFSTLRGLPVIRKLSMQKTLQIDQTVAVMICSFKFLVDLNISECEVTAKAFVQMSQSCQRLEVLTCCNCPGLDDFCLVGIAACVQKFRKLSSIDLSKSKDFTDEGILRLLGSGTNILKKILLTGCKNLSSLTLAGVRQRMSALENLNLADMILGQSAFEWIAEGCRNVRVLDLSRSVELDDVALTKIGQRCSSLTDLNISRCPKVSDIGIVGFAESFSGELRHLDLSICIQCTGRSALALAGIAGELIELKLNGLSQITEAELAVLWNSCVKLLKFEMTAELRATSTHRRSMIPHISDSILCATINCSLEHVKLAGACLVTDTGVGALAQTCPHIKSIDISHCHGITDAFLIAVAQFSAHLTSLDVTGCVSITNKGISSLCCGCTKMTHLRISGCSRVTDVGVAMLSSLPHLETLVVSSCEYVTDRSLLKIGPRCKQLKHVDISNLDLASAAVVESFSRHCPLLTTFNCESCNFTAKEFATAVNGTLPYGQAQPGRCRLDPRDPSVVEYNKYVYNMQQQDLKVRILQRLAHKINRIHGIAMRNEKQRRALLTIARVAGHVWMLNRRRRQRIGRALRMKSVKRIQRWWRRAMAVLLAIRQVAKLRRRNNARSLLQRVFRGHRSRKRTVRRFHNLYQYYNKIGRLVYKYILVSAARRVRRCIVKVQSIARMFPIRLTFVLTREGFMKFQRKFLNYWARRQASRRALNWIVDRMEMRLQSFDIIQRNWKAHYFNKMMSKFMHVCAIFHRTEYDDNKWYSELIQKRWRGYMVRLKRYRQVNGPKWRLLGAIKIQSQWRKLVAVKRVTKLRKRLFRVVRRLKMWMKKRPKLRLGRRARIIQRSYLLYRFQYARKVAARIIAKAYKGRLIVRRWCSIVPMLVNMYARSVARAVMRYVAKIFRKRRIAREHMAIFKIQVCK